MKNRALVLAVAIPFTVVSSLLFLLFVAGIAATIYYRPTLEGSYGIGAVSTDVAVPVVLTLLFVGAALWLNLSLASYAKSRSRRAVWLRRLHLAATVLTLVWPGLAIGLLLCCQNDIWNRQAVIAACATAISATHLAIGILAIKSAGSSPSPQPPLR